MTLSDFNIKSICYDKYNNALVVQGNYELVNSIEEVNNNYLYAVTQDSFEIITDNFISSEEIIGIMSNGNYIDSNGYIINSVTYDRNISITETSGCDYVHEGDNGIYGMRQTSQRGRLLVEYNYTEILDLWSVPNGADGIVMTDDEIIAASEDELVTYNYNGKEMQCSNITDFEVMDRQPLNFGDIFYRMLMSNDNIVFYDDAANAFRTISEN